MSQVGPEYWRTEEDEDLLAQEAAVEQRLKCGEKRIYEDDSTKYMRKGNKKFLIAKKIS
jgi:hypothetical protein